MRDRRGAIRYRCQLRCTLRRGAARHDATVLDLSSSGLSIRTTLDLAQGDEIDLRIEPEVHEVGQHMGVADRLIVPAHDAKRDRRAITVAGERRNDGMHRPLARRDRVGVLGIE